MLQQDTSVYKNETVVTSVKEKFTVTFNSNSTKPVFFPDFPYVRFALDREEHLKYQAFVETSSPEAAISHVNSLFPDAVVTHVEGGHRMLRRYSRADVRGFVPEIIGVKSWFRNLFRK